MQGRIDVDGAVCRIEPDMILIKPKGWFGQKTVINLAERMVTLELTFLGRRISRKVQIPFNEVDRIDGETYEYLFAVRDLLNWKVWIKGYIPEHLRYTIRIHAKKGISTDIAHATDYIDDCQRLEHLVREMIGLPREE